MESNMAFGALWLNFIGLFAIHLGTIETFHDKFSEELFIKRLPNAYLYAHFQFTTVSKPRSTATGKDRIIFILLEPYLLASVVWRISSI